MEPTGACRGLVLRYRRSVYEGRGGGVVEKVEITPLKKMSCPGCRECCPKGTELPLIRAWEEDLAYYGAEEHFESIMIVGQCEDGDLLKGTFIEERDWETGRVEGGHWELEKYKPGGEE